MRLQSHSGGMRPSGLRLLAVILSISALFVWITSSIGPSSRGVDNEGISRTRGRGRAGRGEIRGDGGDGGENGGEELESTLKRNLDGRAAVVILRVVENDGNDGDTDTARYLVQRKSSDYPIKPFRDAVCLFGGNAKPSDSNPLATLRRELSEELPPALVQAVFSESAGLKLVGTSTNAHTAALMGRNQPYAFLCACYEARIPSRLVTDDVLKSKEGSYALLRREQLLEDERYAWGYDAVVSRYLGRDVRHFCDGATVTRESDDRLEDWTPPPPE